MCLYLVMKLYFVLKVMDEKNAPSTLEKKLCLNCTYKEEQKCQNGCHFECDLCDFLTSEVSL